MPFQIIRNDITKVEADAIVNTANPMPVIGRGTDTAIYEAAGLEELLAERERIGEIPRGHAAATPAFNLPAKHIIHTVGPKWIDGSHGEEETLRSCYRESLELAEQLGCESVAFPLLASGNYKYPKELAIRTATSVIYDFLMSNDMMVYLVVYDKRAFDLSGKIFPDVQDYLDGGISGAGAYEGEDFAESGARYDADVYGEAGLDEEADIQAAAHHILQAPSLAGAPSLADKPKHPAAAPSLQDQIKDTGVSFSEYLLQLIIDRDLKNSEVYRGANISKQVFSKIFSKKNYHPTKNTICALAVSLHLTADEANDLLEKEGMVLSASSPFDIAVRYFLDHKMYNIVDDNIILYKNDLETLGQQ